MVADSGRAPAGALAGEGQERPGSPPMLVLVGPTASGKSALAVRLARVFAGEVVNADSRQVYRGLDVATAKPADSERAGVPHHLFDVVDPDEDFSAAEFRVRALAAALDIASRGRLPIVVGGSGLYVRALLGGFFPGPSRSERFHPRLEAIAGRGGLARLYRWLGRVDPERARAVRPGDRQRVLRALDVYLQSGEGMSAHFRRQPRPGLPFDVLKIGLDRERADLYARIDRRVDAMIEAGLVEEAARLRGRPGFLASNAAKALGYREIERHLAGELRLEDAAVLLKRQSRRLAKRQMTWFRREPDVRWIRAGAERGEDAVEAEAVRVVQTWLSQRAGPPRRRIGEGFSGETGPENENGSEEREERR